MPKPAEVTTPSDREVRVTRTFNAPRQLVWDAHTKPDLVRKWQGYGGWDMPVCDMEVRVGGKYRWQWKNREDGQQFGFFGTFTEVDAPSKLAHEQYFDPGNFDSAMPAGDPCIVSVVLSEHNGITTLVCNLTFASKEARDDAVSTGMTDGMEYSYGRLDELVGRNAG
ncbi:MAG: SRPBCC family protein [Gemmatimonadota bacterium]|nr:SRPBCC family protein [Gemmatimonadota bacterium]MDE3128900.1 SRPBCC family protein [Gemmatimonadota bacterium]MDE3172281.1 SRPBCC family protein [Gemmatimonadota bacterium]MDE3217501.1 SRPBCC family protein [Gemmatimonadota bacterium]